MARRVSMRCVAHPGLSFEHQVGANPHCCHGDDQDCAYALWHHIIMIYAVRCVPYAVEQLNLLTRLTEDTFVKWDALCVDERTVLFISREQIATVNYHS